MKHLVRIATTPGAARINQATTGPGPFVGRLVERFRPEAVYMSPARREIYLVCDLTPTDMTELMLAGTQFAGETPDFVPVMSGADFGGIVGKALPAAKKLLEG